MEAAEENWTESGAPPAPGVAEAEAVGGKGPGAEIFDRVPSKMLTK